MIQLLLNPKFPYWTHHPFSLHKNTNSHPGHKSETKSDILKVPRTAMTSAFKRRSCSSQYTGRKVSWDFTTRNTEMSRKENISPNAHIDAAHMSTHRKWQVEMVKWFVAIKQHQKNAKRFGWTWNHFSLSWSLKEWKTSFLNHVGKLWSNSFKVTSTNSNTWICPNHLHHFDGCISRTVGTRPITHKLTSTVLKCLIRGEVYRDTHERWC